MALWPNFTGPAYRARSQSMADDLLINLYPEISENPVGAKQTNYYGTPGLKFLLTAATGVTTGCRGSFEQDNVALTTIGANVYSVNISAPSVTLLGTIPDDGKPVSYASNGRGGEQIVICGGGQLKVLNLLTMVLSGAIVLPLTNAPVMVDFTDGYFLLTEANTIRVWFSALEDGTTWDALDFFAVSLTSSNVVGIKVMRDRIWVFQSQSALVYYDSGDADNPFVPYPGSVMQEGAVTPWGIMVLGETMFWLAQDNQGRNRIVSAQDYAPTAISTPPISFALASYSNIDDAEAFAYEQEDHPFIGWNFTSADKSWFYDMRTQQWHERSYRDTVTGTRHRWRARGVCSIGQVMLAGDYQTGDLYTLDLDTFTDNGATIERVRRAPYLSGENQWLFLDRLELGMQPGIGTLTGQGVSPQAMLSISRDGGFTFGPPTTATFGEIGAYGTRAIWRKLGRARADRLVIEITQTDPVRAVWGPGLWLKARPGSGEL